MADARPPFDFPELLNSIEEVSANAQKRFYVATGATLVLLAAGSVTALVPETFFHNIGSLLTLVLFIVALVLQISQAAQKAEKEWYEARSAAESIKTASWEFAVGGEVFRKSGPDESDEEKRYINVLKKILHNVKSLDVGASGQQNSAVTDSMKKLRATDIPNRCKVYREKRVQDQIQWYSRKAEFNRRRGIFFSGFVIVLEFVAVILGIARVMGSIGINLLGPIAAIASGLVGWMQAKKYTNLAEVYAMTSQEINLLQSTLRADVTEPEWAQSVHDAEAAFSRENTMWQARRQSPV